MSTNQRNIYHWLLFISVFLGILLFNQLSSKYRWLLDFTEEGRYTFHPATQSLLADLDEPVLLTVYLEGELPANFKRFKNAIQQTLDQFSIYGGSNFQFRFIDPSVARSTTARNQYYRQLIEKGLQPSNVTYNKDGNKTERLIFPGAILSGMGKEIPINLLKSNRSMPIEQMLNQSIEGLEYEISDGLLQLLKSRINRVGIITSHGTPDTSMLAGLTNVILKKHQLFNIDLQQRSTPLTGYDAIILAKPSERFAELEKYWLDQYVMAGGNLLVFVDALTVDLREADGEGTVAVPVDLNLDDLLFKYGVRINKDYVADANCGNTPVVSGMVGNQPRIELLPWPYSPVITNYGDHPTVKNLDASWFRHVSTIDTVKADGIEKTSLMKTSEFTRVFGPPVTVSYNDLRDKLRPEYFTSGVQNIAYLLEGSFTSLYSNRFLPRGTNRKTFLSKGQPARVLVVSDGDYVRSEFDIESGEPLEMGVDPYTQTAYANAAFIEQMLDYAFDEDGLMLAKNKEVMIRPLDKVKVSETGPGYRWLNIVLPIALVWIFGVLKFYLRRNRYAHHG